jgi:hypothetical protein
MPFNGAPIKERRSLIESEWAMALAALKTTEEFSPEIVARPKPSTAMWILDLGRLEDLRSSLRADNVYSFISIYLHNLASHMDFIRTAYHTKDIKGVIERAQMMMNTSENVGAIQNWDLAGKVYDAAKTGSSELADAIEALRYSVEATSDALENWRDVHVGHAPRLYA